MSEPAVSVIVRTFDSAGTVVACLESVRSQDVPAQIIVVDSGSTDGTLGLVADLADRVEHVARDGFSYGGALNVGADAATAPVHVALSSHCVLPRTDWLRIAATHIREGCAAAVGAHQDGKGNPLNAPFKADHAYLLAHRHWGMSNHAAAWDAAVWSRHRFDESLLATEDKEWSWRALGDAGPLVADPRLLVSGDHRRGRGLTSYFHRRVKEIRAVQHLRTLEPYGVATAVADWLRPRPHDAFVSRSRPLGRTRLVEVAARFSAGWAGPPPPSASAPPPASSAPTPSAWHVSCAAVVPVRGHAALLDGCLDALVAQGGALDEIVVVDDSPDGSIGEMPGVRVVRSGGVGPYAARNAGAAATAAEVLLFLDVRSRPRAGWAAAMSAPFVDPQVGLAGTESRVSGGPSLAEAASELLQFSRLRNYLGRPYFKPYLPTCNLAVRRADFREVGGFSGVRSGGDADLCWRILQLPDRRLSVDDEVYLDWIPRTRVVDFLEQNYRYGKGNHGLRTSWAEAGAPQLVPLPYWLLLRRTAMALVRGANACARGDRRLLVQLLASSQRLCFDWGYRSSFDAPRRQRILRGRRAA